MPAETNGLLDTLDALASWRKWNGLRVLTNSQYDMRAEVDTRLTVNTNDTRLTVNTNDTAIYRPYTVNINDIISQVVNKDSMEVVFECQCPSYELICETALTDVEVDMSYDAIVQQEQNKKEGKQ